MSDLKTVYIVHCIDTEGPLYESLEAKFGRLEDLYGISNVEPTMENFVKLQKAQIDLGGSELQVAETFSGHLSNYNDTWDKIDNMLDSIMSDDFRNKLLDSYGGGYVFNWHCVDHVGYKYNPRRRDIGYHNIFDHYDSVLKSQQNCKDGIHWHFHPMSTYRDAHRCATSYINSSELYQIICRRIIEREWFPTVNRAGFHVERPDSHWFLEQWIPFDISNISLDDSGELENTVDLRKGRAGDWRRAPSDWSIYHPSHDNYQIPGNCRRWIARVLNSINRLANIDQREMDKAFAMAQESKPTLVGITGHDFRDLGLEVDHVRGLILESCRKYPDVKFKYSEAVEAFRSVIWPDDIKEDPLDLELIYSPESEDDVANIEVVTRKGQVFGPQPFLAIETMSRRFIHDNFDFALSGDRWHYPFYSNTIPISDVKRIGIGANDKYGNYCVKNIQLQGV